MSVDAGAAPRLTVAVPTCNGVRHLPTALESLLAMPEDFDLIIVDDRSDDETVTLARAQVGDRGRVVQNSERLGLARNWNRCLALSTTPLVAIFHQDDVMFPGHLTNHLARFRTDPTLGWVASAATVIDDRGYPVPESVVARPSGPEVDPASAAGAALGWLAVTNPLRCSGVTMNAAAHAEVGGFDPSFRYVVDWDFWARVALVRPVAWLAEPTVAIRWHQASETHRFVTGTADLEETARLIAQFVTWIGDGPVAADRPWRRAADRRLARAYLNRAHMAFKNGDPALARHALTRAFRLAGLPTLRDLLGDPRLLAQMIAVVVRPRWGRRS